MNIGIITAQGLGDGLIFHIAAHHLKKIGHHVTTFNDHLPGFQKWLSEYHLLKQPSLSAISELPKHYDAIILQHDNLEKSWKVNNLPIPTFRFFGSHSIEKHGTLTDFDYIADRTKPMAFNVVQAIQKWFGSCDFVNGLIPPKHLIFKKNRQRIVIHHSSSSLLRNWPLSKFEKVAQFLEAEGYEPFFISAQDHTPKFSNLDDLASFIFESGAFLGNDSGPGHLASYLNIPSLIIGKEFHHLALWQPGWRPASVITPPLWATHFRWGRTHWDQFITTKKIIKTLKSKVLKSI